MTKELLDGIDDVVHGRVRLGVLAYLNGADSSSFVHLKEVLGATDGNLSAQIRTLTDAKYVSVSKSFSENKPQTNISITLEGRAALLLYKKTLAKLLG